MIELGHCKCKGEQGNSYNLKTSILFITTNPHKGERGSPTTGPQGETYSFNEPLSNSNYAETRNWKHVFDDSP
jgi:hypothetical protein